MIEDLEYPILGSNISKRGVRKNPDGQKKYFTILDEIIHPQSNAKHKKLCLQLVEFEDTKEKQLRFGYYIIGKKPKMKGKWVWGQYAPFVPTKDFIEMFNKAKSLGWFS